MPDGLKKHSHQERARLVAALVPLIKRHAGKDLLALAATGSFARGTDGVYSDIELAAFVRRSPDEDRRYLNFIFDGMGIDLWFLTRGEYIDIHKGKVRHDWPYAASSILTPLLNEPYISALSEVTCNVTSGACRAVLRTFWPKVHEATTKLLTAVERGDVDPIVFLYGQMAEKMCAALSLLNAKPFTTRAAIFAEARAFGRLPEGFDLLVLSPDQPIDPTELARRAILVFGEIEQLIYSIGINPYERELGFFVSPLSGLERARRALNLDRLYRRVSRVASAIRSGVFAVSTPKRQARH